MKKKILLSSILVIVLCLCVVVGSTFALFTENTKVNIAATAADLDVSAVINQENVGYKSLGEATFNENDVVDLGDGQPHKIFANGGTAQFVDNKLKLDKITPGDAVKFTITVTNNSEVAVMYTARKDTIKITDSDGKTVARNGMLTVSVFYGANEVEFTGENKYAVLQAPDSDSNTATFTVVVEFVNYDDHDSNNIYQGCTAEVDFIVDIVQYNGVLADGTLYENPVNP